jgi:hypothetical protein
MERTEQKQVQTVHCKGELAFGALQLRDEKPY